MLVYWLDIVGTMVFAVSGVLLAGKLRMDPFGVLVLGVVTAVGGGTIRDMALANGPVFWVKDPTDLVVAMVTCMLTIVLVRQPRRLPKWVLPVLDAVGLAVFVGIGVNKAFIAHSRSWVNPRRTELNGGGQPFTGCRRQGPACGTSRNVLALIRNSGVEPTVIEYLKTPPDRATLVGLIQAMDMPVHDLLRQKGMPYDELGLGEPKWTDEQLIDFMLQHPILINRPIVVSPMGTRLCRPSEVVLDILPQPQQAAFSKEDGEAVIDSKGNRIGKL